MWSRESDLIKLNDCVENKKPYLNTINLKDKKILIIKYQFLSKFDVKVLDINGKYIHSIYDSLSAFDCFNIVEELIEMFNKL